MPRIHHVGLRVADVAATERYYAALYGAEAVVLVPGDEHGAGRLSFVKLADDNYLELFSEGAGMARADAPALGPIHVAFGVEDVDEAFAEAIRKGATEVVAPRSFELDLYPGRQIRYAYVANPDGDMCEFVYRDLIDRLR